MNTKEILKFCIEKGFLLDKDTLELFSEAGNIDIETSKLIIEKIGQYTQRRVITKNVFNENRDKFDQIFVNLPEESQKQIEKLKIKLGLSIEISREITRTGEEVIQLENSNKEMQCATAPSGEVIEECDVKIMSMDPTSSKKLEVGDFVKHFRNRFFEMSKLLRDRGELESLVSINKISNESKSFSIIGLVSSKRTTKNKNMLIELEDLTGKIVVLFNANKPELFKKAEEISLDSVIGVKGSGNREIVFVNDVFFVDSMLQERKKSPFEEYALFIGDLHVGSKKFMESNFLKFINYLNGDLKEVNNQSEISKIKYIFLVGDLVAGVGIYPNQENELNIPDVEEQYMRAAELLGKIRKDIKIIISPGNHDALRIMEPQPLLDEKFAWAIYDLDNVILTGNPSQTNIGAKKKNGINFSGFNVLTYHGYSFHYYANNISYLMQEKAVHSPEKIMAYLLKNRHLAPTHSSTLYFPSVDDSLFIKEVPDIFFSGHTHKSAVSYYNNILIISSSTWESLTAFQEKMGNEPDFCKVPMFNLKTREVKILDFE